MMRDMRWFGVGYAGLGGFIALEAAVRDRGSASSLDASSDDQSTTRAIVAAGLLATVFAPIVRRLPQPRLPAAGPVGALTEVAGLGLRVWSMRTLRAAYTRTLRTAGDQTTVERGPYAVIRHPGYLGSLLVWVGFAMTSRSPAAAVLVGGLLGRAYERRITAEERLLARDLPGYLGYARRTWRLIPLVW
jgi:protein-S-isoprenylcysteine O-methyltransferase Ste14